MADLLGDLPEPTLAEQIAEVEREIRMRERLYSGWVSRGTLKAATAERQLRAMRAVPGTLRARAALNHGLEEQAIEGRGTARIVR